MAVSTRYDRMYEVHGVNKIIQKYPTKATLNVLNFSIKGKCQKQPLKVFLDLLFLKVERKITCNSSKVIENNYIGVSVKFSNHLFNSN